MIPFNMANLVLGTSSVTVQDYLVGTLFILPNCVFNVYLGTTIRNIEDAINGAYEIDTVQIVVYAIGGVLGLGTIIFMAVVVYFQLQKQKRILGLEKSASQVSID